MKIKLVAYGIAKDILGVSELDFDFVNGHTVIDLKNTLILKYPAFDKLKSLKLAVNEEYQNDEFGLTENCEVVIIPPVSGG
ncbi:MAG: MoaD/ThiS family protein [Bacteroidia bacterium]